jgi:hypothetical protein
MTMKQILFKRKGRMFRANCMVDGEGMIVRAYLYELVSFQWAKDRWMLTVEVWP